MGAMVCSWWFGAESFLAVTARTPAEILILEAWTMNDGAEAAAIEFESTAASPYDFIVAAGGPTGEHWSKRRWFTTDIAQEALERAGVDKHRIIAARARDVRAQRTFESAVAARRALDERGIQPRAVNVFTRAAHARRSRLIYSKVFGPTTRVGVIAWIPAGYTEGPWWQSSERADELVKETIGYVLERLFSSGRTSSSPESHRSQNGP